MLSRRHFLSGVAGSWAFSGCKTVEGEYEVSAAGDSASTYGVAIYGAGSRTVRSVFTGFRGHGLTAKKDTSREVAVFGRRPGHFLALVDIVEAELLQKIEAGADRRFQGHGEFTPDGKWLLASEENPETGEGFVGLYDARDLSRQGELPTHGHGPHELRLLPDGETIVVANTGIRTGLEAEAPPTNLDTMDSSLVYLELRGGKLLEQVRVNESKASLRHLGMSDDGTIVVGAQVQREAVGHSDVIPLAVVHKRGGEARWLDAGLEYVGALNDYVGSVAIAPGSQVVGLTSPRGNLALFYDFERNEVLGTQRLADVCGLAGAAGGRFVLTASTGALGIVNASTPGTLEGPLQRFPRARFDNHLLTVTL
ncbi:MAG: DUF1513 domain-containing protein [Archangium sp.]